MGVGIELDTENSCRKYQVCKPVAPQKTSVEAILLRFFVLWLLTGTTIDIIDKVLVNTNVNYTHFIERGNQFFRGETRMAYFEVHWC